MTEYLKLKYVTNIILLFTLFFSENYFAQEKPFSISATTFLGNGVGKYKGEVENVTNGFLINLEKNLKDDPSEWVRFLNAKNLSVGFLYTNLNGIQYPIGATPYSFGESFGIISHIDFGIINKNRINLYFSPGFGITYIDKTVRTNPESFVFGSHLNAIFKTALKGEIELEDGYSILSEINFLHFSNGSYRIPNAGVNLMNVGLGIKKNLGIETKKRDSTTNIIPYNVKKNALQFSASIGRRGKYKMDGSFYRINFYGGYSKFFNNVIALKSGLDFFYYEETYNPLEYEDSVTYLGETRDHFKAGLSVGTEVKMNKFSVNANFGYYLYFKSVYPQKTYWNIGFKYYLNENFGLQTNMNAHRFQADFINCGVFVIL